MSEIRWCDIGGHAFSMSEPGSKTYVGPPVSDGQLRERVDICGPCVAKGSGMKSLSIAAPESKPKARTTVTYPSHTHTYGDGICAVCGANGVSDYEFVTD